nr:hypothetical protein CBIHECMJ_00082 [Klebsiella pneumoniae]WOL80540.1 hypothetical protein FEJLJNBH_00082 [Enterobacter hormaechei subsp. steigerwaltii]WOL81720.1 hypothetical protein KJCIIEAJ_00082 [Escherichia coli]WOL82153.1 hypothetical protein CBKDIOPN_00082 [Klebsiella oxytoca]WOL80669.1 hypothetical protein MDFLPAEK_00078 [Klebsiella pneumoniae]
MPGHKYIIGHFVLDVNTVKYKKARFNGLLWSISVPLQ